MAKNTSKTKKAGKTKSANKVPKYINVKDFLERTEIGIVKQICKDAGKALKMKKAPKRVKRAAASILGSCICSRTSNAKYYLREKGISTSDTTCGPDLKKRKRNRKK